MILEKPITFVRGERAIRFLAPDDGFSGGLGIKFDGISEGDAIWRHRERLLDLIHRVDRGTVAALLNTLGIGANQKDADEVAFTLDSMRVTNHREDTAQDNVLRLVSELNSCMPAALKQANADVEMQDTMETRAIVAKYRDSLVTLARAAERVDKNALIRQTKQDWHDDAVWIAVLLYCIAERAGKLARLSFKSPSGPTTNCIAKFLALAEIKQDRKDGQSIQIGPDAVRKALRAHPQAHTIGLSKPG